MNAVGLMLFSGPVRMDNKTDQYLVERVQGGDKQAFDILVKKYQHRIVALVSRFLKNSADVQDVTQEAFIKAYRALPNFRGDSAFYTWLYRIAVNTAKNHLVSQGRRPPSVDLDVSDAEQFEGSLALKEQATPERLLLKDEIQRVVSETIEGLSEDLRTAITLRELEGMSYEEIAEVMGCPVGTVRSRIFRARETIQVKLKTLLN
ncbi:RNA polymerase sigma factor RpoE [hydrothermal vent metagenome]|uniref:RNA polymerase sigma factor RpoE n=1 Tax=hydrothermal vent metagenome TaxID=652676 RepID=A0A3B0Z6F6_9ZZZZ